MDNPKVVHTALLTGAAGLVLLSIAHAIYSHSITPLSVSLAILAAFAATCVFITFIYSLTLLPVLWLLAKVFEKKSKRQNKRD